MSSRARNTPKELQGFRHMIGSKKNRKKRSSGCCNVVKLLLIFISGIGAGFALGWSDLVTSEEEESFVQISNEFEFLALCNAMHDTYGDADSSANGAIEFEELNVSVFDIYTCLDNTLLSCKPTSSVPLIAGNSCANIDPAFTCQCSEGRIFAATQGELTDGLNLLGQETPCGVETSSAECLAFDSVIPPSTVDLAELLDAFALTNTDNLGLLKNLTSLCEASEGDIASCINDDIEFICLDNIIAITTCSALGGDICVVPPGFLLQYNEFYVLNYATTAGLCFGDED